MFKLVDKYLFNSSLTKSIYDKFLDAGGEVLSITHGNIKDKRVKKSYTGSMLKVTYLGPDEKYKGYNLLLRAMKMLKDESYNEIKLNIYGNNSKDMRNIENIIVNGRYTYDDLEKIFMNTDVLIVPSIWNETFGFIVLEALSYGVPIIVTNKVGSKDLLNGKNGNKGVVINASSEEIKKCLINLYNNRNLLIEMNNNILSDEFEYGIEKHCRDVRKAYLD